VVTTVDQLVPPNTAMSFGPFGTMAGVQLFGEFQSPVGGVADHIEVTARADGVPIWNAAITATIAAALFLLIEIDRDGFITSGATIRLLPLLAGSQRLISDF
jgi:hypothetical protein